MKLSKFRVQNYRSIIDTGVIDVNDIMVLVGPNQAGKSSILKGLNSIAFTYNYDVDNELTQLNNTNKKFVDQDISSKELPIITATFELDDDDKTVLKERLFESDEKKEPSTIEQSQELSNIETLEISPNVIITKADVDSLKEITVTKFIDENYSLNIMDKTIDFENPFNIIKNAEGIIYDAPIKLASEFTVDPDKNYKDSFDTIHKQLKKALPTNGYKILEKDNLFQPLMQFSTNPLSDGLKKKIGNISAELEVTFENYPLYNTLKIISFLIERMPRPVYFKDYNRLEDSITIHELKTNPKQHSAFINLLQVAEVKISSLVNQQNNPTGIQQYLKNAGAIATEKLRKVYKQESFDLEIRYDNGRIMVFTSDPNEPGTLLPPSYGSEGFQWFLGFYINFAVATRTEYKNAILLLDDPGVLLHPSGHKDLIRRFNSYLDDNVRTIYTTHLPSLIQKSSIDSIRVVYRDNGQTKIDKNFWKLSNLDIWAPIRASLGIDLTDSLFFGNQTVMVEGPSDAIYFQDLLKILRQNDKNVSLRFILPIGGLGNTDYFTTLFESQNLPFVMVTDESSESSYSGEKLIKINPKNKSRISQTEFDIEDMIENELIAKAFSNIFEDIEYNKILTKLKESNAKTNNILKGVLAENEITKNKFDKIKLARQIIKLIKEDPGKYSKTLENFEDLFKNIEQTFQKQN